MSNTDTHTKEVRPKTLTFVRYEAAMGGFSSPVVPKHWKLIEFKPNVWQYAPFTPHLWLFSHEVDAEGNAVEPEEAD